MAAPPRRRRRIDDCRFTTAAAMVLFYRARAERAFENGDMEAWRRDTDLADEYAAWPPDTSVII